MSRKLIFNLCKIKSLLQKFLYECAKEGTIQSVILHVNVKNEIAINLYKSCGFIIKEYLKDYWNSWEEDQPSTDAYLMSIELSSFQ